tara:strand:- start:28 stop:468 length:441 start_codon:yes stop_codon:yes gene_type:complete
MDEAKWRDFYSKASKHDVWVKVMTNDQKHFFLMEKELKGWIDDVKTHCYESNTFVEEVHLQFRSHKCVMDLKDSLGVYLVRSAMGEMGGVTTSYLTFGVLKKDGLVHKQMWMVPELLKDKEYADPMKDCFEEAIIYNEKTKADTEE